MSTQNIFPAVRYRDADAALAWLSEAFGAEQREVYRDQRGRIQHAELTLGDGLIMFGSYDGQGSSAAARPTRVRARSAFTSPSTTPTRSTRAPRGRERRSCAN
jgi:uncharacterized glyoxalase superfamily protein PhnB